MGKEKKESWLLNQDLNTNLFYLLVLILPIQLGYHFWPNFSFIFGARVDYLSPTIFLTDLLILFAILYGFFSTIAQRKIYLAKIKVELVTKRTLILFIFLTALLLSFIASLEKEAFILGLVRLVEMLLLLYVLIYYVKRINVNHLISLVSLSLIVVSIIGIGQFILQSSIGGLLYFLGERTFNSSTLGIASVTLDGAIYLRPYSIFPHPNVMAAFILIYSSFILEKIRSGNKTLNLLALILGGFCIFLSMSRVSIILYSLMILFYFFKEAKRPKLVFIFSVIALGVIFLSPIRDRFINFDEGVGIRTNLSKIATQEMSNSPIFGIGINNFLYTLGEYPSFSNYLFIQPVHNIYLLVAVEVGIPILLLFLYALYTSLKRAFSHSHMRRSLVFSLISIILIGLFDHFFLTLQQGQLLLVLVISLIWTKARFTN